MNNLNVTDTGQVCLRTHFFFLIRYKKTGMLYGKRGSSVIGPEHFFDTSGGANASISWIVRNQCVHSWHPLNKDPDATDKNNWEVVPVTVTAKVS